MCGIAKGEWMSMQTCLHPGDAKGLLLRQQLCSVLPGWRRTGCLLAPLLISLVALCTAQPLHMSVTYPPVACLFACFTMSVRQA